MRAKPSVRIHPASRRGFTLIELCLVITVLGILALIAIPNYVSATQRAKRGSCFSNQRNVAFAAALYSADRQILDGVVTGRELFEAQYLPDDVAECPTSTENDQDDYDVTLAGGEVVAIDCLIEPGEHHMEF